MFTAERMERKWRQMTGRLQQNADGGVRTQPEMRDTAGFTHGGLIGSCRSSCKSPEMLDLRGAGVQLISCDHQIQLPNMSNNSMWRSLAGCPELYRRTQKPKHRLALAPARLTR